MYTKVNCQTRNKSKRHCVLLANLILYGKISIENISKDIRTSNRIYYIYALRRASRISEQYKQKVLALLQNDIFNLPEDMRLMYRSIYSNYREGG